MIGQKDVRDYANIRQPIAKKRLGITPKKIAGTFIHAPANIFSIKKI